MANLREEDMDTFLMYGEESVTERCQQGTLPDDHRPERGQHHLRVVGVRKTDE